MKTEEDDISVSEVSAEQEHLLVKQEIWEDESRIRIDRNREALDEFSRRHQLRVKEEWNRPSSSNQNPGRKGVEFNPMKVEIFPRSPGWRVRNEDKENQPESGSEEFGEEEKPKRGIFSSGESEEESVVKASRVTIRSGNAKSVLSRTVGPWGSVSQVTQTSTAVSESKKVKRNTSKQSMKKGRNRRMKPEQARMSAEKEKARIQDMLKAAEQLWKRLECPVKGDSLDILKEYHPDAIRYARQGKKFLRLAAECGTIRAKTRMRDEWKAVCYSQGLDHRTVVEDSGFDEIFARYSEKVRAWHAGYFGNWYAGPQK